MGHLANTATTCMQALKSPFPSSTFTCWEAQRLAKQLLRRWGTQHHRQTSGGASSLPAQLTPSSILPCLLPSTLLTQTSSLQPQQGWQSISLCGSRQQHEQSVLSLAGWLFGTAFPHQPQRPHIPPSSHITLHGRHDTPPASCSHTTATLAYPEPALPTHMLTETNTVVPQGHGDTG